MFFEPAGHRFGYLLEVDRGGTGYVQAGHPDGMRLDLPDRGRIQFAETLDAVLGAAPVDLLEGRYLRLVHRHQNFAVRLKGQPLRLTEACGACATPSTQSFAFSEPGL